MNAHHAEALLREHGCTLTPQRRAILQILDGNLDHPTAADVFAAVTRDFPRASRATVYNTLALLEELGAVRSIVDAQAHTRFDPNIDRHHHRVCPSCGQLADVPSEDVQVLLRGAPARATVRLEQLCEACDASDGLSRP